MALALGGIAAAYSTPGQPLRTLRAMVMDRRLADPVKFAHIRQELGI
jgi:hypothetical protein